MHDQPAPTPEEHEQGLGRQREEEEMRQAGHSDPDEARKPDEADDDA